MADEQKQPWYKSVPGILTAATGFIAALSGLVAGLNQLGVFRRDQAAPPAPVTAPAPGTGAPVGPSTIASGGSSNAGGATATGEESSTAPAGTAPPKAPSPAPGASAAGAQRPAQSSRSAATAKPTPSVPPAKPAPAAADTADPSQRLPSGTSLQLTVPTKTCASGGAGKRFTARLTSPVKVGNATVLPVGTTATLHLKKSGSTTPDIRLDSLVRQTLAVAVPSADVAVTRGMGEGCLRAGARLTATLGAPVAIKKR